MFPFFSYMIPRTTLSIFLIVLVSLSPPSPAAAAVDPPPNLTTAVDRLLPNNTWRSLMRFLDAGKGTSVDGMAELKKYFGRFGYLPPPPQKSNATAFTDLFDDEFESALLSYQRNLGLPETGKLDHDTMTLIVSPRCGVSDEKTRHAGGGRKNLIKTTKRYAFFYGEPRWVRPRPMTLTYAFSAANTIGYLDQPAIRAAFERAFARWSAVIPVKFTEAGDYSSADIRIGWYGGDHGDGEAFDGVLGVLAHAFSPENGRFHLDAAERWAVDFEAERSKAAVDLESVATHEIGHVLGLAHSSAKEAIMYPSLSPRTRKVELREDDVAGIQELYGSNPNYRYDARLESDVSSGRGMDDLEGRKGLVKWSATMGVVGIFFSLGLLL